MGLLRGWHDVVSDALLMDNLIKKLRDERHLSQRGLAEILEVSRQTVNSIEKGRYDPSLPLAFKISRCFARSIEEIFSYDEASD